MSCQIIFDNPTGVFSPGNAVSGKLVCFFNDKKDIRGICLKFRGREHTFWSKNESYYDSDSHSTKHRNVFYSGDNKFLTNQMDFMTTEESLGPGQFEYPFQFVLPIECPGSCKTSHGSVWYYLKATVDIPWFPNFEQTVQFTVIAPVDLNNIPSLDMAPSHYEDEKYVCCWCCKSGPIRLDVNLEKRAYVLGEIMKARARIVNRSNVSVKTLTATLKMTAKEIVTSPKHDARYTEELVTSLNEAGVGARRERNYDLNMVIPEDFVLPNFSMCSLFEKWCTLKVEVELPKCHTNMDIKTNITLGHIPLRGTEISQTISVVQYPCPCSPGEAVAVPLEFPQGQSHLGFNKEGYPNDIASYSVELNENILKSAESRNSEKSSSGGRSNVLQSHETYYVGGSLSVEAPYPVDSPGFPQPVEAVPTNVPEKPVSPYRPPSSPRSNVSAPYPTSLGSTTPNPHYHPPRGTPMVQEPLSMPEPTSGPIAPASPIGFPRNNSLPTNSAVVGMNGSSNGSVVSSH